MTLPFRVPQLRIVDGQARPRSLSRYRTRTAAEQAEDIDYPDDIERPQTWGECQQEEGPCPWVSCRFHLYLDVIHEGTVKLNFPDREVWELEETCALAVAERGGQTLDQVGRALNITRERVRQMEVLACAKAGEVATAYDGEVEFEDPPVAGDVDELSVLPPRRR